MVPHMRTFADRAQTPKPPNTPKPQLRPTEHQAMWPDESASSLPRRQVELQESAKDRTFYMQKVEQVRSHCLSMRFSLPLIAFSLRLVSPPPPFHAFFTASHCILTASLSPSPVQAKQQRSRTERLSAKGLVPTKVRTRGTKRGPPRLIHPRVVSLSPTRAAPKRGPPCLIHHPHVSSLCRRRRR